MGITDLTGPRAKLGRANEHLRAIDDELRTTNEKHSEPSCVTFGRDESWYTVRFDPLPPLPLQIALIAGDCLNNIRAALDHLVWQLVLREDGKPSKSHYFPLYESGEKFIEEVKSLAQKGKRTRLHGIPVDGDAWA